MRFCKGVPVTITSVICIRTLWVTVPVIPAQSRSPKTENTAHKENANVLGADFRAKPVGRMRITPFCKRHTVLSGRVRVLIPNLQNDATSEFSVTRRPLSSSISLRSSFNVSTSLSSNLILIALVILISPCLIFYSGIFRGVGENVSAQLCSKKFLTTLIPGSGGVSTGCLTLETVGEVADDRNQRTN